MHHRLQSPCTTFRPHITGGTDAALQQPGLVIKTMWIGQAMRPFQPHRQLPAFAGMNIRQIRRQGRGPCHSPLLTCHTIPLRQAPPRQHDALRHPRIRRQHLFDIELETQAAFIRLGQTRHYAGDCDVAALPFRWQRIGQSPLCTGCSPDETRSRTARQDQQPSQHTPQRLFATQQQNQQYPGNQRSRPSQGRQRRLLLQPPDTGGEGNNGDDHDAHTTRHRLYR